jgi:HK97 gp10 family phage protein
MDSVKIEGLRELEQMMLETLPKATARATLQRVLKKRALPVQAAWKAKAPRDEGHYADSIIVGTRLTKRQARDAKREGKFFAEVHIGTDDPAGQQQEFGNGNHPAQPSGRPAWEETQNDVLVGIGEDIMAEIDKSAARIGRKAQRLARG